MGEERCDGAGQALYFVSGDDSRWIVSHSGAHYPYRTRSIAISAAIDAANTSGKRGHGAQVLVAGDAGEWEAVWVFGRDPYPPIAM